MGPPRTLPKGHRMKSALFVVSTLARTGPTQQLLNLCKYLPEFGWRPRVVTLSPDPAANLARAFADAGVQVETFGLSRMKGLLFAKRRLRALIRRQKPQILHTSGLRSDALGHGVTDLVPHVMTIRNFAWDDYPAKFGRIAGSLMAARHTMLIKSGRMVVGCSHALAQRLSSIRPSIHAIPNGVDLARFPPTPQHEKVELRVRLGLDPARAIYLFVGALIPLKQPQHLLNAFLRAPLEKTATLLFLGDGPLRSTIEATTKATDRVRVVGEVDNVVDYYRCADYLISASTSEGLPNVVMEALACGLPVVLSEIPSHLEFQVEEARAGFMASVTDVNDLATKIAALERSDWSTLSLNARNLAQRFSARSMAEKYAHLYSQLVNACEH